MRKLLTVIFIFGALLAYQCKTSETSLKDIIISHEEERIDKLVEQYKNEPPVTVTADSCERSAGGIHDFYSEGDYWWPDPDNPDGPYIQKDGQTNPDIFTAHRESMRRFSRIVGAFSSAYLLTNEDKYVRMALPHLNAWFVDTTTRMNPNMLYAQAIKGRTTGRGIGIIDALHLVEVARSVYKIQDSPAIEKNELDSIKNWFNEFLAFISTHDYGKDEMQTDNNHATAWTLQAAAYAQLTENDTMLTFCEKKYKEDLLPNQMDTNGSFPLELDRTKPYGYSLFNIDVMTGLVHILSEYDPTIWEYSINDKSIKKGMEFIYPYIKDKSKWDYGEDVLYWDEWPVAQPSLYLTGIAFNRKEYIQTWKKLERDPEVEEVQRNLPIRYPLLWVIE